jgi:hypothetical protein
MVEELLTILHMHFHCRPIRCLAHPQIQILAFPGLKEENIVAIIKFSELIQLVQFRFRVEFHILSTMWQ